MSLPPHVTRNTSGRGIAVQSNPFDDWETAYERNDRVPMTEEARNAKLWSDANAPGPTYSIMSSSSTPSVSLSTSRLPPPAAFSSGPALTILKRPTSAPSSARSSSSSGTPNTQKTLQQREREYEQARRRIYGEPPLPELESGVEALSLGGGGGGANSVPSISNGERGTRGPRSNSDARSKSNGGSTRRRNGRGAGGGGAASSTSSSSSLSLGQEKGAGAEKGGEGAVRAPKGPNADGGFGFGGGAQGERSGSSSGRGRGRGRGR